MALHVRYTERPVRRLRGKLKELRVRADREAVSSSLARFDSQRLAERAVSGFDPFLVGLGLHIRRLAACMKLQHIPRDAYHLRELLDQEVLGAGSDDHARPLLGKAGQLAGRLRVAIVPRLLSA